VLVAITPDESQAAKVKAARSTKALLNLSDSESVNIGDVFVVKKGDSQSVLVVTAVKGSQAMCEIRSGKVRAGDEANLADRETADKVAAGEAPSEPAQEKTAEKSPEKESSSSKSAKAALRTGPRKYKQVSVGGAMNPQTVKLTEAAEVSMSGVSFFAKADYGSTAIADLEKLGWEAGFALEMISTKGTIQTSACKGSSGCVFETIALTPGARLNYLPFGRKMMDLHLRTGVEMLIPLTFNSNVIDAPTFTPLMFGTLGLGFRMPLSGSKFIPFGFDFGMHFGNADVSY
jgi:hypothetical protein